MWVRERERERALAIHRFMPSLSPPPPPTPLSGTIPFNVLSSGLEDATRLITTPVKLSKDNSSCWLCVCTPINLSWAAWSPLCRLCGVLYLPLPVVGPVCYCCCCCCHVRCPLVERWWTWEEYCVLAGCWMGSPPVWGQWCPSSGLPFALLATHMKCRQIVEDAILLYLWKIWLAVCGKFGWLFVENLAGLHTSLNCTGLRSVSSAVESLSGCLSVCLSLSLALLLSLSVCLSVCLCICVYVCLYAHECFCMCMWERGGREGYVCVGERERERERVFTLCDFKLLILTLFDFK